MFLRRLNFLPALNRAVRYFIIGDLLLWAGWGFMDPIFSLFVIDKIIGATLFSIGYLAGIYWITRSICVIPVSLFLDKTKGEKDDFYFLVLGLIVSGAAAFGFIIAETITTVYILQFFKALGFALYIPAFSAIITRHLNKNHAAFGWSLDNSLVSLGIGAAGLMGGIIAAQYGFGYVFLATGLFSISSAIVLLFIPDLVCGKKHSNEPISLSDGLKIKK